MRMKGALYLETLLAEDSLQRLEQWLAVDRGELVWCHSDANAMVGCLHTHTTFGSKNVSQAAVLAGGCAPLCAPTPRIYTEASGPKSADIPTQSITTVLSRQGNIVVMHLPMPCHAGIIAAALCSLLPSRHDTLSQTQRQSNSPAHTACAVPLKQGIVADSTDHRVRSVDSLLVDGRCWHDQAEQHRGWCVTLAALLIWSPMKGTATMGTAWWAASYKPFRPHWVRKACTPGCASTSVWGAQSMRFTLELTCNDSHVMLPAHTADTAYTHIR